MGNSVFAQQFTSVPGTSNKRRLPLLDRIRLGIKTINKTGIEYPKEVDYFVLPNSTYGKEIEKTFGVKPKEIDVWFPSNDMEVIFPQSYTLWGSSKGAKCRGNGEDMAMEKVEDKNKWIPKTIPCKDCEKKDKECKFRGYLRFMIPQISAGGIFQIATTSYNSVVDVMSGLDFCRLLIGRFSMIPFKLSRFPKETHGSGRKEIHYCLRAEHLIPASAIPEFKKDTERILLATTDLYQIEPPKDENPAIDEGAVIETEEEPPKEESLPENEKQAKEEKKAPADLCYELLQQLAPKDRKQFKADHPIKFEDMAEDDLRNAYRKMEKILSSRAG